jgi:hypothetical protein
MLGWEIIVCKQTDGGISPATMQSAKGKRITAGTTGLSGLNWLDTLVKTGKATELGDNGYPLKFTGTAANLVPSVVPPPPEALTGTIWLCESLSALADRCPDMTVTDLIESVKCGVGERLLIEGWDQS